MSFKNLICGAMFSLGACLLVSQAHAIALTDVSFQNSEGGISNPTAASQGRIKSKKSANNDLGGLLAGNQWSVLDQTNKPPTPFDGVNFVLTADTKHRSGNWALSWDSSKSIANMEFVLVLKGGGQWAAYRFATGSIDSHTGSIAGMFNMPLINKKHGFKQKLGGLFGKKHKKAKLRRATIFGRLVSNDPVVTDPADPNHPKDPKDPNDPNHPKDPNDPNNPDDPNDPNDPNQDPNDVPIPSSITLVIMGLALCGRLTRRRLAR